MSPSARPRVAPFADKHKMIVAMHGHDNTRDPNQFASRRASQAMALSKNFWVNLDIGHFFAAGYDPVAYIEEHHDRISNLHIKDRKKDHGENTPWGEGDTPIKQVLQLLKAKKYDIPADIEYEYRGGTPCRSPEVLSVLQGRARVMGRNVVVHFSAWNDGLPPILSRYSWTRRTPTAPTTESPTRKKQKFASGYCRFAIIR